MFRKNPFRTNYSSIFSSKVQNLTVFSTIYKIRIRFFWARGIKSEGVSGGTVSFWRGWTLVALWSSSSQPWRQFSCGRASWHAGTYVQRPNIAKYCAIPQKRTLDRRLGIRVVCRLWDRKNTALDHWRSSDRICGPVGALLGFLVLSRTSCWFTMS